MLYGKYGKDDNEEQKVSTDDSNEMNDNQDFKPDNMKEFGNIGESDHKESPVRELIKLFEKICKS